MSRQEAARSLEPHTAEARSIPQVEVRADASRSFVVASARFRDDLSPALALRNLLRAL
jgi:hypothetical protein